MTIYRKIDIEAADIRYDISNRYIGIDDILKHH